MRNELTELIDDMLDRMPHHPLNKMTWVGRGYNKQQMIDQLLELKTLASKYDLTILCAKQHTSENEAHNEMIKKVMNEEAI